MVTAIFPDQPTLVGHRGMGKGVVEGHRGNTLDSFLAALRVGLDWVEVDVQRSRCDQLFVHHDAALADGRRIVELSGGELVDAGVLPLRQLLEALPLTVGVVFDVKSTLDDADRHNSATTAAVLATNCREIVKDRPVVAMSFDPAALLQMRQIAPSLPLGLLTWLRFPLGHAVAAAAHLDIQVLGVHAGSMWRNTHSGLGNQPLTEDVIDRLHALSRQLAVWCPSVRRARSLARAGVDALIVDDVPRHVRARARGRSWSRR